MTHQTRSLVMFFTKNRHLANDANENMLINSGVDTHSLESLEQAAARLQLTPNSEFQNAWDQFRQAHPERDCLANRNILFTSLEPNEPPCLESFESILNSPKGLASLSFSAGYQRLAQIKSEAKTRAEAELAERKKWTQFISGGHEEYSARNINTGRKEVYKTEDLEDLSLAELRKVASDVGEQRRLENASTQDLRRDLNKTMAETWNAKLGAAYPVFPKQLCLPGDVRLTTIDSNFLRHCQPELLRKYTRIYGNEQVNARLNGVD